MKCNPELLALHSENKLLAQSFKDSHKLALKGLATDPENPRLLTLAAESAGQYANNLKDSNQRLEWYKTSANYWLQTLEQRPNFAYATREAALTLDWSGQRDQALPLHLRAIGQAPNSPIGYEYLGIHFLLKGEREKAIRLLSLAQTLPNSRLAIKYLNKIHSEIANP
jgi:tetratricopeptide (TPR) repeat protein